VRAEGSGPPAQPCEQWRNRRVPSSQSAGDTWGILTISSLDPSRSSPLEGLIGQFRRIRKLSLQDPPVGDLDKRFRRVEVFPISNIVTCLAPPHKSNTQSLPQYIRMNPVGTRITVHHSLHKSAFPAHHHKLSEMQRTGFGPKRRSTHTP
jgi:hypothetical protein